MKHLLIIAVLAIMGCTERSETHTDNRTTEELRAAVVEAMKSGDYAAAEELLTSMIAKDPKDIDSLGGRAAVRVLLGDAEGASKDFDAAIKMNEEKGKKLKFHIADRSIWRARELDMAKKYPEALKIYDVLLHLYPESGMAYHDRGGLKTSMGDYEGAIADLTDAIKFDEGNNSAGDSYTLRARAKRAKGDEEGAKADEAKAQELFDAMQK